MEDIKEQSAQTTETDVVANSEVGASEIADASNDVEFTDSSENNTESNQDKDEPGKQEVEDKANKDVNIKPQKTNADYARERRKAEQEAAINKAKVEAILQALDGENPYTHEKMEDAADVQEYLTMKEIEKSGGDPIADYSKHLKAKAKEKEKASQEKSSQEEWVQKDRADFVSKHPDVKLEELLEDNLFRQFAIGRVGKMSMDKIYNDYNQTVLAEIDKRATDRAAQLLANNAATPGKLTDQSAAPPKSVEAMSKAEFEQMIEKVKRGEKI